MEDANTISGPRHPSPGNRTRQSLSVRPADVGDQAGFIPDWWPITGLNLVSLPTPIKFPNVESNLRPALSAQAVPNPTATAMLIKRAAFHQYSEMLLERVAAGPGQLDDFANGDASVLAGELDDL